MFLLTNDCWLKRYRMFTPILLLQVCSDGNSKTPDNTEVEVYLD